MSHETVKDVFTRNMNKNFSLALLCASCTVFLCWDGDMTPHFQYSNLIQAKHTNLRTLDHNVITEIKILT